MLYYGVKYDHDRSTVVSSVHRYPTEDGLIRIMTGYIEVDITVNS